MLVCRVVFQLEATWWPMGVDRGGDLSPGRVPGKSISKFTMIFAFSNLIRAI